MSLLFIDKVKENRTQFAKGVEAIARKYGFSPNWLMAVINSETGGTFSPSIRNAAGSGATGLIQFMPNTARSLGTTTDALARMSNVEQLDYVDRYIASFKQKIADYDDLYFIVFYPAAIGKPDGWRFPQSIYRQNAGVDSNKDGVITVADFKAFIRRKIPADMQYLLEFMGKDTQKKATFVFLLVCIITACVMAYLLSRKN